jgi:hypothetical protein
VVEGADNVLDFAFRHLLSLDPFLDFCKNFNLFSVGSETVRARASQSKPM